jgi:thiamine biosynthesis lipoprotein
MKILLAIPVLSLVATPLTASALHLDGTTMGTSYGVTVPHLPGDASEESLRRGIDRILTAIEQRMSTYRSDSEISHFNRTESTDWTSVSQDTAIVVLEAQRMSRLSGGAFDITVAPLVDLWGFGPDRRPRRAPSSPELQVALARVGFEQLEARAVPAALRKRRPDVAVDLSAIAVGFAVDRVAEYLQSIGLLDYLVEIGGEMRGRGHSARGGEWMVAIEQPGAAGATAAAVVRLSGRAIATSGDYRTYFEENGRRYSHVIDPRTGLPIAHDLASVSVVDVTTMRADALATALMVLGPDHGPRLAEHEGLAALFVIRNHHGLRTQRTPAFDRLAVAVREDQ